MDFNEFKKIKYEGKYYDGNTFKEELENANVEILENTEVDDKIHKIVYYSKKLSKNVTLIAISFGSVDECGISVIKTEHNINNDDIKNFIYYATELEYLTKSMSNEDALKQLQERDVKYKTDYAVSNLLKELDNFENKDKKYNNCKDEIYNIINKHGFKIKETKDLQENLKSVIITNNDLESIDKDIELYFWLFQDQTIEEINRSLTRFV